LGKLKQSGVSWSPIQETFEQGLVSGVMRCLLCGMFPLFCVVHALVVFSSFLSHPEDRSLLHPPPSPFLPPMVARSVVIGAPTVALEYISKACAVSMHHVPGARTRRCIITVASQTR